MYTLTYTRLSTKPERLILDSPARAHAGPAGGYYIIYEIASTAEGATFTSKPGAAPQGYENRKDINAESAIHFRHTSWISAN
jgi:hypothetical protein